MLNFSFHPPPSPNSSLYECFAITDISYIYSILSGFHIVFILPLFIFTLYLGLRRWYESQPASTVKTSNLDLFTYNVIVMEIISMFGGWLYCIGTYMHTAKMQVAGNYIYNIAVPGQMLFHILTCVERYLAVIHPVFYMGLRKAGGVRNISIGLVWVKSFVWIGIIALYSPYLPRIPLMIFFIWSVIFTSFLSISVLHSLMRPGPGERGGDRERVNQSKRRAFNTIATITGALLLRFGVLSLTLILDAAIEMNERQTCLMLFSASWFAVPNSYVLPVLFLHRAGKLPCFKSNIESA